MSDIEKIKDLLITAMKEAEIIKLLDAGEKKKDYVLNSFLKMIITTILSYYLD